MTKTQESTGLTLEMRRVIRARRGRVFTAWTRREQLEQWMCRDVPTQNPRYVELDARVGGGYAIEIPVGDSVYRGEGIFQEVTPPEKLVFTWSWRRFPPKMGRCCRRRNR